MALLGIDLGTSAVKVVALDTQGRTLASGRAEYGVSAPQPGWAESDPEEWWRATVAAVRAVRSALAGQAERQIEALGLSGQMHGVVLCDAEGQPLRPAILWADARARAALDRYRALAATDQQRLANPLALGMAGPSLLWLAQHEPDVYGAARWALQPKDWLRARLTSTFATDPSDASATLLYDLPADDWAEDVLLGLGLRRSLLPPILPSAELAGALTASAAAALGLPAGLPVAVGAADTAAAALGAGLLAPGSVQLTLGTGAQLVQLRAEPLADHTLRTHLYRAADPAYWYSMAAVQNAGLALDWVRRTLGASWDDLYASAESVGVGAEGISFLPHLVPERLVPQSVSGGAFLGLRHDHRREHLLHAALEGVVLGIREALEALPGEAFPSADAAPALRLAGGGSVHPAWRQMLADALGRELIAVEAQDASARGAALLAGIAVGVWRDAAATAAVAPPLRSVAVPDGARVRAYATLAHR